MSERREDRPAEPSERACRAREYRARGQVQGVGFRPFVYRLATQEGLGGQVWNDPGGVTIVVRGEAVVLDRFAARLREELPALARLEALELVNEEPCEGPGAAFEIRSSARGGDARGRVTVDSATCADCVRELFDREDPRYGHALINCTNCGPRYTIVRDLPYDRSQTTMAGYPMCARCAREYRDPGDRRFHAQPVCCPNCGPQLRLVDAAGGALPGDPIVVAASKLLAGAALAMKGLGGYHLVVDACNAEAVHELRAAKRRRAKPFAVMFPSLEAALRHVELSEAARALLASPRSPIVLARLHELGRIAEGVPAGTHRLGIMLPYTPMQHLLLGAFDGPLVMTSANESDDPLLTDDSETRERLGPAIDLFLQHDRPIERAVDDSIVIDSALGLVPLRRARGYVPEPLPLPVPAAQPGITTGADLKNTVAIVRDHECVLGQHVGDLEHARAHERCVRTLEDLQRLWELEPVWVASDLHPGYHATRHARRLARERGLDHIEVQHHHAHLAALLAEHGRTERILALVCDGVGYGSDGEAWGGELLAGDLVHFERLGRVRPLRLPGGDVAAKHCGRCALSWLFDLEGESALTSEMATQLLPDPEERRIVAALLRQDLRCPPSSGVGRLFDAAAALLGVTLRNEYEAQSGMLLEALAARQAPEAPVPLPSSDMPSGLRELDTRPLLHALLAGRSAGRPAGELARLFHESLAAGLAALACAAADATGIRTVGLSGGVFANALLSELVTTRLLAHGLEVLLHRLVPPNDGALAYGQAAVAAAALAAQQPPTPECSS